MSIKTIAIFLLFIFCANAHAESNSVVDALRATYEICVLSPRRRWRMCRAKKEIGMRG